MWSKKATGRVGNGDSVQAKLNSPKPTPRQGLATIRSTLSRQIAKRDAEMSVSARRSAPPNTCLESLAQRSIASQLAP